MDIGHGLASFGNSLADAMQEYHKRHRAYEEQMKIAEALSNVGITENGQLTSLTKPDANGKEQKLQGVTPLLNSKAYEQFRTSKQGEWDKNTGALDILNRMAVGTAQRMIGEKIQNARDIPTDIGGVTVPLTPGQRATVEMQRERFNRADTAAEATAKRQSAADKRAERHAVVSEEGLKLRKTQAAQSIITNAPETAFFKKTGISPQFLLTPESLEQGYGMKVPEGKIVSEVPPLKAGESLQTASRQPPWWKEAITLGFAKPQQVPVEWVPKPGGAYREAEYKYPSSAKKGQPSETKYAPHPEGEFLRIGDQRIPFQEATRIRSIAETRRREAMDMLKQKPELLPAIKERLAKWGYDPNAQFWGLPQE